MHTTFPKENACETHIGDIAMLSYNYYLQLHLQHLLAPKVVGPDKFIGLERKLMDLS